MGDKHIPHNLEINQPEDGRNPFVCFIEAMTHVGYSHIEAAKDYLDNASRGDAHTMGATYAMSRGHSPQDEIYNV